MPLEMNFCRRCGAKLSHDGAHIYSCSNGHTMFANASPTVAIFFVDNERNITLSRRGIEPGKGMLDSFGGFLDGLETAEAAVTRELREETSLEPSDYEPPVFFGTATAPYRYQNEDRPIISLMYWSRLKPGPQPKALDDVAEIVTLPINDVKLDDIYNEDVKTGFLTLKEMFK